MAVLRLGMVAGRPGRDEGGLAQPSITASTPWTAPPAARNAASALPALMTVSRINCDAVPRRRADIEDGADIGFRVHAGELFNGRCRGLFAEQRQEFLRLQPGQHPPQTVGAFRVPGSGIMFQAGRVGDQGHGHGAVPGFLLAAADQEAVGAGFLAAGQQGVAGLAAIRLEVGHRRTVGGQHPQPLARRQPRATRGWPAAPAAGSSFL